MSENEQNAANQTSVAKAGELSRFEILVDGAAAGFAEYLDLGKQRVFFHTVVDDKFQGQGLAGKLVTKALDQSVSEGMRIVPVCPYVAKFLEKHEGYGDAVDAVTPDVLAALDRRAN